MKIQTKTSEPRLEIVKELLCFVPMLEANDGVVRVAHDNHVAGGTLLPPLVDPLIIDMMEVNGRQERTDDRTLWRPFLRLDHAPIFEHACRQPFGNQPDNPTVANPMLDEPDQPFPADLVEKGLDVTIEHPVDPPLPDPKRERIQRLMLAAFRSETVAEAQEFRLIDRRQNCHHRSLDNLVLHGRDAERTLSAICLWNILPERRQRSIRPCVDTRMQVPEVCLKVFCVLNPRHLVDTRRCSPLQAEEARSQNVDVDVMQKRRQLVLSVPGDGFSYAG